MPGGADAEARVGGPATRARVMSWVTALLAVGLLGASAGHVRADDGSRTTYGAPSTRCTVTDPRLDQVSGMAASRGALYVVNDTAPVTVWQLDGRCRAVRQTILTLPTAHDPRATLRASGTKAVDLEDIGLTADGALWLADTGGNTSSRNAVSLYRWVPGRTLDSARAGQPVTRDNPIPTVNAVSRYDLRYPDGARDVEALLVTLTGQVVLVTKVRTGVAGIYAADLPLEPTSTLRRVGTLDLRPLLPGRTGDALAVTGGAVSPDGVRFVLRTPGAALEWDAPDGDVARALRTGVPRQMALGRAPQGEAITYTDDGTALLTAGEQVPSPLGQVAITRTPGPAPVFGPVVPPAVLAGAGASVLLTAGLGLLAWRRRTPPPPAAPVETEQRELAEAIAR
ncbi:hypothetical protein [Cryptosporangium aurantiacum]|uniref:Uncharacterized protein n=1 Tax=Cryptosporangium aurantiacum TaxID=134849 RepID=A0A1M7RJP6_9ACTN|nr:hypothetical protein [Cryptosporangium aurantiacum]SHN46360.1 hypothetical protein SAMN05443668_11546 [Cryptosporangium aurantiacum]